MIVLAIDDCITYRCYCIDVNCNNESHLTTLKNLYDNVAITDASSSLFTHKQGNYTCQPGWIDYVADTHKGANKTVQGKQGI